MRHELLLLVPVTSELHQAVISTCDLYFKRIMYSFGNCIILQNLHIHKQIKVNKYYLFSFSMDLNLEILNFNQR